MEDRLVSEMTANDASVYLLIYGTAILVSNSELKAALQKPESFFEAVRRGLDSLLRAHDS